MSPTSTMEDEESKYTPTGRVKKDLLTSWQTSVLRQLQSIQSIDSPTMMARRGTSKVTYAGLHLNSNARIKDREERLELHKKLLTTDLAEVEKRAIVWIDEAMGIPSPDIVLHFDRDSRQGNAWMNHLLGGTKTQTNQMVKWDGEWYYVRSIKIYNDKLVQFRLNKDPKIN